ncbi:MAG TPA: bifunctional phosphoribosylaminoimidazolecarboxamide formyltransferase/IMP cyclohydrolase [Treponemataceae bacterium]|nr:bifunctional phosphoribosylaminoimidazolecarboxamide formyltransferase/IMP cyclohydrolase [Treponemataceae bacterium]
MKKRALISVYDKEGILDLADFLINEGWEILSTGGTAKYLEQNNISVVDVSDITGFPECLDGRVKTLHPKIHAGLLAQRQNKKHMETLKNLDVYPIDLVCVNLYPFFEKVQANLSFEETIEFIDIGGPAMLRSAAKNFQDVIVITDPEDYSEVITEMKSSVSKSSVPPELKKRLAGKVFNLTSAYDAAISRFMLEDDFPPYLNLPLIKGQSLRYGENAHQNAALYLTSDRKGAFSGMRQIQGKELSYNNIRDLDVAWKAVSLFVSQTKSSVPTKEKKSSVPHEVPPIPASFTSSVFTIALKHNTPCGAALGKSVLESYNKTFSCDPISIFGGIVGSNAIIDKEAAEEMIQTFLEVIVAPGFTDEALDVFASKKNLRLIVADIPSDEDWEYLSVDGGLLVQNRDRALFQRWEPVTKHEPTPKQIEEMIFGMIVAIFVKSNAILISKDKTAIGIAGGQTNRIWAASQALERAKQFTDKERLSNAEVLISDAFFPFSDTVEEAAKYGIKAIIQPGGSLRDQESIDAANKLGIAMIFTGCRHFKH